MRNDSTVRLADNKGFDAPFKHGDVWRLVGQDESSTTQTVSQLRANQNTSYPAGSIPAIVNDTQLPTLTCPINAIGHGIRFGLGLPESDTVSIQQ